MEYDESDPAPGSEAFDNDELADGVHIRQEDRGVMVYALFDGPNQVSDEYGPLDAEHLIEFANGYSTAVENDA